MAAVPTGLSPTHLIMTIKFEKMPLIMSYSVIILLEIWRSKYLNSVIVYASVWIIIIPVTGYQPTSSGPATSARMNLYCLISESRCPSLWRSSPPPPRHQEFTLPDYRYSILSPWIGLCPWEVEWELEARWESRVLTPLGLTGWDWPK
jgi:hypothetical protein